MSRNKSTQHRHGALMRLAARHQNSTIVLRRSVHDDVEGGSPPVLTPVFPTVCIRSGLGRSGKNVAKVNSTWNDNEDEYDSQSYLEDEDTSHNSSRNEKTVQHDPAASKIDMRDDDDERCYRELEVINSTKVSSNEPKPNNSQNTLYVMSGHSPSKSKNSATTKSNKRVMRQSATSKDTLSGVKSSSQRPTQSQTDSKEKKLVTEDNKKIVKKKGNLLRNLSCRNVTDVVKVESREENSDTMLTEMKNNNKHKGQNLSLYKFYAGKTETKESEKQSDNMSELDLLVSQVRNNLRNTNELDQEPCQTSNSSYMNCTHSEATRRQRSSRKDKS